MKRQPAKSERSPSILILGVGAFAQSVAQALADDCCRVATYLTRSYGHYPPSIPGPTFTREAVPNPAALLKKLGVDLIIPHSIDWAQAPWADDLLKSDVPILSPIGEAMKIERERDFARELCSQFGIPYPRSFVARNRIEAEEILRRHPRPYVIKNPLCSPTSPIHTILCETVEDTRSWLEPLDYAEGVFLQEYLGRAEAGHIVLVSGGEIQSLVTNQEYKRAFAGDMGIIAGAPMGGLIEQDPDDQYGLARQLIHPLRPWLKKVNYHGPLQVTAVKRGRKWHVIEYNIRIGVTSGPMILRMLENPADVLLATARNRKVRTRFKPDLRFGCSLTLAGYGYPYVQLTGPELPVEVEGEFDCDVWWNEVRRDANGRLLTTGHRIADVNTLAPTLDEAIQKSCENIRRIRSLGSYHRPDIGQSLWPPGRE